MACLRLQPAQRISAMAACQHKFFLELEEPAPRVPGALMAPCAPSGPPTAVAAGGGASAPAAATAMDRLVVPGAPDLSEGAALVDIEEACAPSASHITMAIGGGDSASAATGAMDKFAAPRVPDLEEGTLPSAASRTGEAAVAPVCTDQEHGPVPERREGLEEPGLRRGRTRGGRNTPTMKRPASEQLAAPGKRFHLAETPTTRETSFLSKPLVRCRQKLSSFARRKREQLIHTHRKECRCEETRRTAQASDAKPDQDPPKGEAVGAGSPKAGAPQEEGRLWTCTGWCQVHAEYQGLVLEAFAPSLRQTACGLDRRLWP